MNSKPRKRQVSAVKSPNTIRLLVPRFKEVARLLDQGSKALGKVLGIARFVGRRFMKERGFRGERQSVVCP